MARPALAITLLASERHELGGLTRCHKTTQGLARRARIVLAGAEGLEYKAIVEQVGADANTVSKWPPRFAKYKLDGHYNELRSGYPHTLDDQRIAEIIERTFEETPPDGTHLSLRSIARLAKCAPLTIRRIWQTFGLQPHRSETLKLSADPSFVDKVRNIVGLVSDHPSGAGARAVRGREEPRLEPGAGPLPSASSVRPGQIERAHPRLHAPWDYNALRGSRYRHWQGYRLVPPAPPCAGVLEFPATGRNPCRRRLRCPFGDGQLREPQNRCRPALAGRHPRWHVPLTPTGAFRLN